jgi:hypothetical protein
LQLVNLTQESLAKSQQHCSLQASALIVKLPGKMDAAMEEAEHLSVSIQQESVLLECQRRVADSR